MFYARNIGVGHNRVGHKDKERGRRRPPPAGRPTQTMKRVLIYSHDTFGLGNMRRMTAVAEYLVRTDPETTVLLVSGSNALPAFRLPDRIDYIKLPCLARDIDGRYDSRALSVDLDEMIELRGNLILSAATDFRPDMIVVDKKPYGVSNELRRVLDVLSTRPAPPRLVLLLRDVLDDPDETRRIWRSNGYHEAIEHFYDAVLVVGDPAVYDMGAEYRFPQATLDRLRYCGIVRKDTDVTGVTTQSASRRILVTAGGGEDGERILRTFLESLACGALRRCAATVVLGPEMAPEVATDLQRLAISAQTRGTALQLKRFTRRMAHLMAGADTLLTMGGYNTVYEGLSLEKRMVVVPRTKPGREQEIRAECLHRLRLVTRLHPNELTTTLLSDTLEAVLHAPREPSVSLDFHGLPNVRAALEQVARRPA